MPSSPNAVLKLAIPAVSAVLFAASSLTMPANPAFAETAAKPAGDQEIGTVSKSNVTYHVLENGLQVVVIPDRRAPVVTHMVWYKAGSADEEPGVSGIAHYLEHLMFKGTKTVADGEFSRKIAEIGGQENAFTSQDYTAYFQRVTPSVLPEMMRLEADRMENLVLTQAKILPERNVVNEERNARTENNPGSLLREAMDAAMYQNHRYGVPIIGWKHEVNALTKDDAIRYYDRFYSPNNAVLVVAGDVEPQAVLKLAKDTYGKVKRRAEPGERARPREPEPRAARRVSMSDHRVRTPSFQRAYLAPSYYSGQEGVGAALDVLSEIVGGGSTGRIYRELVIDKKLAASAGAWYQGGALDDTEFAFYASPRPGQTLEAVEAATDEVITKLLADGVTEAEVKRAQNRLVRSAIFSRDSQATLARIYGASLTLGSTVEEVEAWPNTIRAVTVEDVNRVAREYLQLRRSVTGYLKPGAKEDASLATPATKKEG
ncbi:MAG: pitrilysin family protein [Pseudomonadota bacterium]